MWVVLTLLTTLTGCTDADPGLTAPTSAATSATASAASEASEWVVADPASMGFSPALLERVAADAEAMSSTCLVVVRDGMLVGEWNWQGVAADEGREVFSVTKSVTSTLVGMAQADGELTIDDRAASYIPEWRGTPSARVTVRNLLANDSGRTWSVDSDYRKLLLAPDRTAYAVGLGQQHRPGTVWTYNNAAIQTLDAVLVAATGQSTADFAAERVFAPLGMGDSRMSPDSSGESTNVFFGLSSTCRDLARFGQLFLQRGEWDGDQLVPAAWVDAAVEAPSQDLNAAYGLLWWLNRDDPAKDSTDDRLVPGARADMFAALGYGGQVVLVDPRSRTVVVRLGTPPEAGQPAYGLVDAARVVTEALRPAR